MKKFFYSHPDTVIAALAIVFLGILLAFYLWASNDIYTEVFQALTFSTSQPSESFNLSGAANLDLRGLVSTSTPAATPSIIPAAPASASAATTTATSSAAATTTTTTTTTAK